MQRYFIYETRINKKGVHFINKKTTNNNKIITGH